MVQDNPNMVELEELMQFCRSHRSIYIYDHHEPQRLVAKYLNMVGINVTGFLLPEITPEDRGIGSIPVLNLYSFKRPFLGKFKDAGVILAVEDYRNTQIIDMLQHIGFARFYVMSEWNKRTIPHKMRPRTKENFWLEVNLADHCNLNCQCCDHFSPLAEPSFMDFDQYVRDINRLADLTDHHIGLMKLQGGEPLLNTRLIDYLKVTREVFPDSPICVFTDGILLQNWGAKKDCNFWEAVKEYQIEIRVTCYPIPIKFDAVIAQLEEHAIPYHTTPPEPGVKARVWFFSEIGALDYHGVKHSVKHPFDLNGNQELFRFISCYQFNESIVLKNGRIYTCPMIPYVNYFNKYFSLNLEVCSQDSIDIYTAKSYEEIAEFCTHRAPFCRYCAVHCRTVRDWKQSEHTVDEWIL